MYSGITQGLLVVSKLQKQPGRIDYAVKFTDLLLQNLKIGASVNIDGVCQTVTDIQYHEVFFTAIDETLQLTTLADLFCGRKVSIERSIKYGDEIGGHEIAGHIIGTASILQVDKSENNLRLRLSCPALWMKYILPKGFIAVDGCSLTVGATDPAGLFDIHLIPETLRMTNFGHKKIGERCNIEIDRQTQLIVTTVERFLAQSNQ